MKKVLLSLIALVGLCFTATADEATFTFSEMGLTNFEAPELLELEGTPLSLALDQATGTQKAYYNNTWKALQTYGGNAFTLSGKPGTTITQIKFTFQSSGYKWNAASYWTVDDYATTTPMTFDTNTTALWTGETSSIIFKPGGSGQGRVNSIAVTYTYTPAVSEEVKDVAIDYTVADYSAQVSLSCETEGATIYYGFEKDAVTNVYAAPFKVDASCTVYAYAQKGEIKSNVTEKAIEVPVAPGADQTATIVFSELGYENATYYPTVNVADTSIVLTFDQGENKNNGPKYYTTGAAMRLYAQNTMTVSAPAGVKISKIVMTTPTGSNAFNAESTASVGEFVVGNDDSGDNQGTAVSVWTGDASTIVFTQGGASGHVRIQKMVITYSSDGGAVLETVATPVIEPAATELKVGDQITITCATPDAKIYYTLDGTDPTETSTLYAEPIVFAETCTVKAKAYNANAAVEMLPSEIAEVTYTMFDPDVTSVTFDFTSNEGLASITFEQGEMTLPASEGVDITAPFSKDNVTVAVTKGGTTEPRIWYNGQLRANKNGGTIKLSVPENYSLSEVAFTYKTGALELAEGQLGTFTNKTWTAGKDEVVKDVMFNVTTNVQITAIDVKVNVDTLVDTVEVDENAAPVYYTLQGVRVLNPEKGLYIVVRGSKVTKEVVR